MAMIEVWRCTALLHFYACCLYSHSIVDNSIIKVNLRHNTEVVDWTLDNCEYTVESESSWNLVKYWLRC